MVLHGGALPIGLPDGVGLHDLLVVDVLGDVGPTAPAVTQAENSARGRHKARDDHRAQGHPSARSRAGEEAPARPIDVVRAASDRRADDEERDGADPEDRQDEELDARHRVLEAGQEQRKGVESFSGDEPRWVQADGHLVHVVPGDEVSRDEREDQTPDDGVARLGKHAAPP